MNWGRELEKKRLKRMKLLKFRKVTIKKRKEDEAEESKWAWTGTGDAAILPSLLKLLQEIKEQFYYLYSFWKPINPYN